MSTLNCSDAHRDERRPGARGTLLAAGPIYKLIVIYKQAAKQWRDVTMNHSVGDGGGDVLVVVVVKIAMRRCAAAESAPAGEHVKSLRKLKSFRENYERRGKVPPVKVRGNVETRIPFATNYGRNVEVRTVPI